jgi:hypothetical protein
MSHIPSLPKHVLPAKIVGGVRRAPSSGRPKEGAVSGPLLSSFPLAASEVVTPRDLENHIEGSKAVRDAGVKHETEKKLHGTVPKAQKPFMGYHAPDVRSHHVQQPRKHY